MRKHVSNLRPRPPGNPSVDLPDIPKDDDSWQSANALTDSEGYPGSRRVSTNPVHLTAKRPSLTSASGCPLSISGVAVEKLEISENQHEFGDRKCLGDPCKSLVGASMSAGAKLGHSAPRERCALAE
jgi:hypothetical protein